jgi:hypothetical protein
MILSCMCLTANRLAADWCEHLALIWASVGQSHGSGKLQNVRRKGQRLTDVNVHVSNI